MCVRKILWVPDKLPEIDLFSARRVFATNRSTASFLTQLKKKHKRIVGRADDFIKYGFLINTNM